MAEELRFTGEHVGLLYAKSMLKIMIITFIAVEALRFHIFLVLAIVSAAYFTMPSRYRTDQPYKAAEAWTRLGFGFVMAILLLYALSPGTAGMEIFSNIVMIFIGLTVAMLIGLLHIGVKGRGIITFFVALGIGILISNFLAMFSGSVSPATSIFFLALAFFATLPERKEPEEGGVKVFIFNKERATVSGLYEGDWKKFGDGIFIGLVMVAGIPIIWSWVAGQLAIVMLYVLLFSLFAGYVGGREGRPPIGVIMLTFAILAFAFQFTGTFGVAVFGPYWTTVYNTGTVILDPMTDAMTAATGSVGDAWLAVSCPSCYQAELERRKQLESGLKAGGTTRALELTNFEALNYLTTEPNLDPTIPLVGYIEMENQGEFTANKVSITLKKPKVYDVSKVRELGKIEGEVTLSDDKCIFTECTGTSTSLGGEKCAWTSPSPPEDLKIMNFKCGKTKSPDAYSKWAKGSTDKPDNLRFCECRDRETGKYVADATNCVAGQACNGKSVTDYKEFNTETNQLGVTYDCGRDGDNCNIIFKKAGWIVKIPFEYEFEYTVNASLEVEVMNKELFIRKLLNREFRSAWQTTGFVSEYSGGPGKLSVYTQKQPLRDEELINGRIGLTNDGEGVLEKGAIVTLRMPVTSGITLTEKPKDVSDVRFGDSCAWTHESDYSEVQCKLDKDLDPGESATYLFSYKFKLDENIPVKDLLYTANAAYKYTTEDSIELTVAEFPIQ